MRLLERFSFSHHHHHLHHSNHQLATEECPPALGEEEAESSDCTLKSSVPMTTASKRHTSRFCFRRSATDETVALSHRRVRFQLENVPRHETPNYSPQEAEATWYSPQELKDMKLDCARHVVTYLRKHHDHDNALDELEKAVETCQHVAYDESPANVQEQLLHVLSPVVGALHLCCKSFAVALRERRKTILADVQQAQMRNRRWSYSGSSSHLSTETDLCQAFLVCRASEQSSLPCVRLAGWLAQAVAREE